MLTRPPTVEPASGPATTGAATPRAHLLERVQVDGKQLRRGDERFLLRGVSYGTFEPRADGARYPGTDRLRADVRAMAEADLTTIRTYTPPPDDLLDAAGDAGLVVLDGVFWPDWRYLSGGSRRQLRELAADARRTVRDEARRVAGDPRVAALVLGNEVPADVVRWFGTDVVGGLLDELVEVAKAEDPDLLVTYATFPTTEYLPVHGADLFLCNVFLERADDLRRYLTRLHHLAGDRPLVIGELGLHVDGGELDGPAAERQAQVLDEQMATLVERGVAGWCTFTWTDDWFVGDARVDGWHFGLTDGDRTPRPALDVVKAWSTRTVADLDHEWPSISVVICAYNAEATLDECLEHTCALAYPRLEVLVVDDGSTDTTAAIARRHPRARLLSIPHAGLSVARNAGAAAATGDLIAYLDSDAYPTPEWPWFLALGLDGPEVGGVGGPNLPPPSDGRGAQQVARAPGGPVQVLLADDRAEHVPGCNMAFWKPVLAEVGGCDPVYTAAGDDVDLCWKVLDRAWEIGYHPAALVWHHRRAGLRTYLRQQRGYGKAEALVAARHPDRFTAIGSARWRGRIYDTFVPPSARQRVYRGQYGAAAFQSVYRGGGHALDLVHQAGVPLAALVAATAPLGLVRRRLGVPAAVAVTAAAGLFAVDAVRCRPPRGVDRPLAFRTGAASMHVLQPLVRQWGRLRQEATDRRTRSVQTSIAGPVQDLGRGVVLLPADRPRADLAAALVGDLRVAGLRVLPTTGWEDHDGRILGSTLVRGDLVTAGFPEGCVQVRVRRGLRARPAALAVAGVALLAVAAPAPVAVAAAALASTDAAVGWWRTGPNVRRLLAKASA